MKLPHEFSYRKVYFIWVSRSLSRPLTETRATIRDHLRGVLIRIHVNKKKCKANTRKQETVLKEILVRKAGSKGEYVQARKSVKENTGKQERILQEILVNNGVF